MSAGKVPDRGNTVRTRRYILPPSSELDRPRIAPFVPQTLAVSRLCIFIRSEV
jgi:hypothetical protein